MTRHLRSRPDRAPTLSAARRAALTAGTLGAAGLLLAACSSGSNHASTTTTTRAHHRSSTTTSRAAPSTSTSTTTATAASTCSSGVLHLTGGGVATSAGTSHLTFDLVNQGPTTCDLDGYPSVALFGASGAGGAGAGPKLDLTDIHQGGSPTRVSLAPKATASFLLSVSEVPVNGAACVSVASVQVTPPGAGAALSLPADFSACGGTVGVYPVVSGS